jgi:hypothetical protein
MCFTNLADIEKSSLSGSGSDHTKSAIGPSCGISSIDNNRMSLSVSRCTNKTKVLARELPRNRSRILIWSSTCIVGDKPIG